MRLSLPAFFDASQDVTRDALVHLCNRLNAKANLATLVVHDGDEGFVDAWVGLVFAPAFSPPDEELARGVIGSALQFDQESRREVFRSAEGFGRLSYALAAGVLRRCVASRVRYNLASRATPL